MPRPHDPRRHTRPRPTPAPRQPIDEAQLEQSLAQIPAIAAALRAASDRAAMLAALDPILRLPATEQEALAEALGRQRGESGADALDVVTAWGELGTERAAAKEARRSSIRLHTAGHRPRIAVPAAALPSPIVPSGQSIPDFAGAWATQARESSEVILLLAWKRPNDPNEWQGYELILDFWRGFIDEPVVLKPLTSRQFEREVLDELRSRVDTAILPLTLGHVRALIEEALDLLAWHQQPLPKNWSTFNNLLKARVFRDDNPPDPSVMELLINPGEEPDAVLVDFWSAWAFGDFGLCYDLFSEGSAIHERETRAEYIALRRHWYEEAHPARLRLGAVTEQAQEPGGLWVPATARAAPRATWAFYCSLELQETPIAGQLPEMPMATLVSADNSRHWYWQTFTLERDRRSNRWRIHRIRDEAAAAQTRPVEELLKEADVAWEKADTAARQAPEKNTTEEQERERVLSVMSMAQDALSHGEVALMRLPGDRALHELLRDRARQATMWDRAAALVHRMIAHFGETAELRTELSAIQFSQARIAGRNGDEAGETYWLERAIENARRAVELDRTPESLVLLAELLGMRDEDEEAEALFRESLALHETFGAWADLGDLLLRKKESPEAVAAFEHALRLEPANAQIHWRLGEALEAIDRRPEAQLIYEDALQRDPNDAMSHALMGSLFAKERDYNKAGEHLERALQLGLVAPQVLIPLAEVEAQREQYARARMLLDQAARLDPRLADQVRQMNTQLRDEEARRSRKRP